MNGGLSTIDAFDPKPVLAKYDGQPMPGGSIATERRTGELMKSPFKFKKYGQCGMDVSELWPHLGEVADDICWVRSVYTEIPNHEPSCLMMNTGANQAGRPSMGAWLTYGLGTENQNLPGYVVLCPDIPTTVGPPLWSNGFLPAINQGTYISNKRVANGPGRHGHGRRWTCRPTPCEKDKDGKEKPKKVVIEKNFDPKKILNFVNNPKFSLVEQRRELDLLEKLEKIRAQDAGTDPQVEAVIKSMETAYRMQTEAPEVFDIRKESQATLDMYGPGDVARGALMAVRLVEKGVRMVQLYYSKGDPWDAHADIMAHKVNAKNSDQAFAAVIKDLKQRGLWKDTLVVCGSEFGRTPVREVGGMANQAQARPRSQSVRVHDVAGGRRGEGRDDLRRDRRFRLQGDREAGSRARYPRDDSVPDGHRSPQADVSLQRPGFPADGRRRKRPARSDCIESAIWEESTHALLSYCFVLPFRLDQAKKNMCVPSTFKTHVHLITLFTVSLRIPKRSKNFLRGEVVLC